MAVVSAALGNWARRPRLLTAAVSAAKRIPDSPAMMVALVESSSGRVMVTSPEKIKNLSGENGEFGTW